jgi:diguanylate cyclase (GGDEF)-like protein
MTERFRLPRLQIATKLYGAIALILAVVYMLAAAATQFASRTEESVRRFHEEGYAAAVLSGNLELALEQQRGLVAMAPFVSDPGTRQQDEQTFEALATQIPALLRRLGYGPAHKLSRQSDDLTQLGAMVRAFVRDERLYQAKAMAADYAQSMQDLQTQVSDERLRRSRAGEVSLESIASNSHRLITWVCAAAAVSGLLIGPIGLLLLRRVLSRLQGVGTALVRLARNDTSVDIPGLTHQDEVGRLARSVAVFKSKSIELLQRKGEAERLNLQLDAAINNMPLGLSMFDAQERLLVCNTRYAEMYDLPSELTLAGTARCALWDYREKKGARHYRMDEDKEPGAEHSNSMTIEFGNERIISVARQPLKGGGWVALHEDITLRRRLEQAITHLARHDVLTNLANRALFREQLQQALLRLRRGQGFAVFCLDLDRFKPVNDTLGHPVGDILLKQVSERLLSCVRQGDLVARLGGDEFAIIEANARDAGSSEVLAARIVETIGKPYEINGHRIEISASIGMTLAPRDGADADQLMKNADLALYQTKAAGRNGYSFFKPEMDAHIQVRRKLETDLREALEQDELAIVYQPVVCLETNKVTGFEGLMRWTHPQRGTIQPAEFIALAEEAGLVAEIGEWALRRACVHAARWSSPVKVAVNLSPLQVKRDLIEVVLQALAASGLAPNRLELEITEAALMQDSQNTLATLHQLRQLGVRIAMDNFGRGYCSLSYLRSFPFDKIKIDRAFIADMDRSEESRALVQAIVGLGNSLGMVTVAEGVESYGQLEMVRSFGCAEAQGYHFSPAVAPSDVERALHDTFEHDRNAAA